VDPDYFAGLVVSVPPSGCFFFLEAISCVVVDDAGVVTPVGAGAAAGAGAGVGAPAKAAEAATRDAIISMRFISFSLFSGF
jgi:hypothetical protein